MAYKFVIEQFADQTKQSIKRTMRSHIDTAQKLDLKMEKLER